MQVLTKDQRRVSNKPLLLVLVSPMIPVLSFGSTILAFELVPPELRLIAGSVAWLAVFTVSSLGFWKFSDWLSRA